MSTLQYISPQGLSFRRFMKFFLHIPLIFSVKYNVYNVQLEDFVRIYSCFSTLLGDRRQILFFTIEKLVICNTFEMNNEKPTIPSHFSHGHNINIKLSFIRHCILDWNFVINFYKFESKQSEQLKNKTYMSSKSAWNSFWQIYQRLVPI